MQKADRFVTTAKEAVDEAHEDALQDIKEAVTETSAYLTGDLEGHDECPHGRPYNLFCRECDEEREPDEMVNTRDPYLEELFDFLAED